MSKEPDTLVWLHETAGVATQLAGLCTRMKAKRSAVFLTRFACKPVSFFKWFRFVSRFRRQHRLGLPIDDLLRKKAYKFFALGLPGLRPGALPFCHLRESQRGRIRTFDPVRPRHVRCQTALHAGKEERMENGR